MKLEELRRHISDGHGLIYPAIDEEITRLETELELLWEYVDWESESMIGSNRPPDVDGTLDAATYHSIMQDFHEIWPQLLRARALRRGRDPEQKRWYGEPDTPEKT